MEFIISKDGFTSVFDVSFESFDDAASYLSSVLGSDFDEMFQSYCIIRIER